MYTGEKCSVCEKVATHKIGEEFGVMDQRRLLHNLTNYVCDYHFNMVICPKDNPINQSKNDAIKFSQWIIESEFIQDIGDGINIKTFEKKTTMNDLVNYETAKLLKEVGFDLECTDYFHEHLNQGVIEETDELQDWNKHYKWHVSRPSVDDAITWLWIAKGILVSITPNATNDGLCYRLYDSSYRFIENNEFETMDLIQAKEAGLLAGLKILKTGEI